MHACMYVCMCVYVCCMHACMHACMCIYVCMHVCIYVCMCVCIYVCMCVYVWCMHACMHACMCIYVYMYILKIFRSEWMYVNIGVLYGNIGQGETIRGSTIWKLGIFVCLYIICVNVHKSSHFCACFMVDPIPYSTEWNHLVYWSLSSIVYPFELDCVWCIWFFLWTQYLGVCFLFEIAAVVNYLG